MTLDAPALHAIVGGCAGLTSGGIVGLEGARAAGSSSVSLHSPRRAQLSNGSHRLVEQAFRYSAWFFGDVVLTQPSGPRPEATHTLLVHLGNPPNFSQS